MYTWKQNITKGLAQALSTIPLLCFIVFPVMSPIAAIAKPPKDGIVTDANTNTRIMIRRPNRGSVPASIDEKLSNRDMVIVPARTNSWATIRTIGADLSVRLFGLSKRSSWKFPCEASGDGFLQWGSGIQRACVPPGLKITPNLERISSVPDKSTLIASVQPGFVPYDGLAQGVRFTVCSATNESGDIAHSATMLASASFIFNPCTLAVSRCEQAASSPCMVVSESEWASAYSRAFAICGDTIEDLRDQGAVLMFLRSLLGQSTNCVVQVLSPGDSLLIPTRGSRAAIAFENDGSGSVVSVIQGTVKIVSSQSREWETLSTGETYIAIRGERQSTRDWLQQSELCRNLQSLNDVQADGQWIASASLISQITGERDDFGSLYSAYCGQ
jgi:hypothetical protein